MTKVWPALPIDVRRAIVAHARRDRPRECCGLLVGDQRAVAIAVPMRNAAATPRTRFRIDDSDHIALRRLLRAASPRRHIVGVYHSHPAGPPVPSARDLAEAHYPDWIYVIVGFAGERARVRAFALESGRLRPIRRSSTRRTAGKREV